MSTPGSSMGKPHRTEIHFAAAQGNVKEVLDLIDRGTAVDEEDYDKRTATHVASASGFLNVLEALVSRGANIFAEDRWGRTPIEDAKMGYHIEVVKYLEAHGAQSKSKTLMKSLSFRQIDPNSELSNILIAAGEGNLDKLKASFSLPNAVDVNSSDSDKRTPLHIASSEGHLEALRYLVLEKKANVNVKDRMGNRPLDDAIRGEHDDCIVFLKEHGALPSDTAPTQVYFDNSNSEQVFNLAKASKETLAELHQRGVREMWSWDVKDFVTEDFAFARGSGGEVFRAQFRHTDCVAKTLGSLQTTEKGLSDLANEIRLMALIRHPNIVTFFGACFQVSPPVMLLEYCRLGTLESAIIRAYSGDEYLQFSQVQKFNYAQQIASAMTFLHEFHIPIIHRDLTPTNILVASKDVLKITDFGLAKFMPSSHPKAADAVLMTGETGSYRYMAPEVYEKRSYDHTVDVYSFGMIIYWLFSGVRPFSTSQDGLEAVKKAVNRQRPSLKVLRDYRIQELVDACWRHDPSKRPSFDAVSEALEDITVFTPSAPMSNRVAGRKTITGPSKNNKGSPARSPGSPGSHQKGKSSSKVDKTKTLDGPVIKPSVAKAGILQRLFS